MGHRRGRARLRQSAELQVTASKFRDAIVYPGETFALEMALCWLYQMKYQEQDSPPSSATVGRRQGVVRSHCDVLPLGKCDTATLGEVSPIFQDWLEHNAPGDPWWDEINFGRRLDKVPPASLVAGWYDLFLPAQVGDYEALRSAGRAARLTIGPWTHTSPGLFAETVRDGPDWWEERLGEHPGREPRAPVRVYVMGSRPGRTSPCGRRRGRPSAGTWGAGARSARTRRGRAHPTVTTTTRTTRHRRWAAPR